MVFVYHSHFPRLIFLDSMAGSNIFLSRKQCHTGSSLWIRTIVKYRAQIMVIHRRPSMQAANSHHLTAFLGDFSKQEATNQHIAIAGPIVFRGGSHVGPKFSLFDQVSAQNCFKESDTSLILNPSADMYW